MAGLAAPERYPVRDPKSPAQRQGRILNPVRFLQIGGLDGAAAWTRMHGKHRMADSNSSKNIAPVDRATKIGKVRRAEKDDV